MIKVRDLGVDIVELCLVVCAKQYETRLSADRALSGNTGEKYHCTIAIESNNLNPSHCGNTYPL